MTEQTQQETTPAFNYERGFSTLVDILTGPATWENPHTDADVPNEQYPLFSAFKSLIIGGEVDVFAEVIKQSPTSERLMSILFDIYIEVPRWARQEDSAEFLNVIAATFRQRSEGEMDWMAPCYEAIVTAMKEGNFSCISQIYTDSVQDNAGLEIEDLVDDACDLRDSMRDHSFHLLLEFLFALAEECNVTLPSYQYLVRLAARGDASGITAFLAANPMDLTERMIAARVALNDESTYALIQDCPAPQPAPKVA